MLSEVFLFEIATKILLIKIIKTEEEKKNSAKIVQFFVFSAALTLSLCCLMYFTIFKVCLFIFKCRFEFVA